jgi:hypothetical protein
MGMKSLFTAVAILACASSYTFAQPSNRTPQVIDPLSPAYIDNLRSCLSFTSRCRPTLLTPDDNAKVEAAAYQRNLTVCLRGNSIVCKHSELRPDDLSRVQEVEYKANLATCLRGSGFGCRHNDLRSDDLQRVREAEYKINLATCMRGYGFGCKHADFGCWPEPHGLFPPDPQGPPP